MNYAKSWINSSPTCQQNRAIEALWSQPRISPRALRQACQGLKVLAALGPRKRILGSLVRRATKDVAEGK
jgi:hypothetical protein